MSENINLTELSELLGKVNLEDVSADSAGFDNLPDGYYLSEVETAELTVSKNSGANMIKMMFSVVEDGLGVTQDSFGHAKLVNLDRTKNRKIFIYYPLKDERTVKRFVTDMLKFEGEEEGEPLLEKEAFTNAEFLEDALQCLVGCRIYAQVSTTTNKNSGEAQTWTNLISWKRAKDLDLPR